MARAPHENAHAARRTPAQQGKASRRKGQTGERELAKVLTFLFPDAERSAAQSRRGSDAADIEHTPFWLECKRKEGIASLRFLEQAEAARNEAKDPRPALVAMRESRSPWTVLMRMQDLLTMLAGTEALKDTLRRVWAHRAAGQPDRHGVATIPCDPWVQVIVEQALATDGAWMKAGSLLVTEAQRQFLVNRELEYQVGVRDEKIAALEADVNRLEHDLATAREELDSYRTDAEDTRKFALTAFRDLEWIWDSTGDFEFCPACLAGRSAGHQVNCSVGSFIRSGGHL